MKRSIFNISLKYFNFSTNPKSIREVFTTNELKDDIINSLMPLLLLEVDKHAGDITLGDYRSVYESVVGESFNTSETFRLLKQLLPDIENDDSVEYVG